MAKRSETGGRLDDAARAGWLYYVAGRTQDEIAGAMGISRQSAQRLVSLAVAERLIKVRLDHPIAACLELGRDLMRKYGLKHVDIVPSDPASTSTTVGIAEAGAAEIERWLKKPDPIVLAIGTGRTLKAAVDQLPALDCPQHRVVSLTGNIGPDGSAAYYNVVFSMVDAIKARHFPMPLPVLVSSAEERELLHQQALVRSTLALGAIEVDVSSLTPGMSLTVKWRGKPVFIRNRTDDEVKAAKAVELSDLKDPIARNANIAADAPATDIDRSAGENRENWIIMVGVCTHLGCIPLGQEGEFGGWFCPCHGSVYDTAGRIRHGPAPENMEIPVFKFISDTKVLIG